MSLTLIDFMGTFLLLSFGSIAPSAGAFFVFWAKLPPTRWALAQQRYRLRKGFRGLAVGFDDARRVLAETLGTTLVV